MRCLLTIIIGLFLVSLTSCYRYPIHIFIQNTTEDKVTIHLKKSGAVKELTSDTSQALIFFSEVPIAKKVKHHNDVINYLNRGSDHKRIPFSGDAKITLQPSYILYLPNKRKAKQTITFLGNSKTVKLWSKRSQRSFSDPKIKLDQNNDSVFGGRTQMIKITCKK